MPTPAVINAIRRAYALEWTGIHGVGHWARVLENGVRLASLTGARLQVVRLFAVFHDSRRVKEGHDPGHGRSGADFAAALRGELFQMSDEDFELLRIACTDHTLGKRVGIRPDPNYLCTEPAKDRAMILWAYQRSTTKAMPELVKEWEAWSHKSA